MSKESNKVTTLSQLIEKKKQSENDKYKILTWYDEVNDVTFQFYKCNMDMLLELMEDYPEAFPQEKNKETKIKDLVQAFEDLIFRLLIIDGKKLNDSDIQDALLGEKKIKIMPSEIKHEVVKAITIDKAQILSLGGAILDKSNASMQKLDSKVKKAKN